jgi:cell wall-associated NlpC family hydrolase
MADPDPRIHPFRADLAAAHLRDTVAAPRYATGTVRTVTSGSAALRRRPADDAPLDTELLYGETVTVYDESGGWAWLQNAADGYVGYVRSDALGPEQAEPTHRLAVLRSFVFPEPNLKIPPRDMVSLNAALRVTGKDGAYSRLSDGHWIYSAHLSPVDSVERDHAAVALRFLGTPYLWGGRTSIGLDCSALVQLSLARCGISVPRDTDMQAATIGTAVDYTGDEDTLRRGDLVFWRGHVGIWVDRAIFVHANATDMMVAVGPLADIATRIEAAGAGPVTAVRRP